MGQAVPPASRPSGRPAAVCLRLCLPAAAVARRCLAANPLGEPLKAGFQGHAAFGVEQANVYFDGGAASPGERIEETLRLFLGSVRLGGQFPSRRSPELDVGVANYR